MFRPITREELQKHLRLNTVITLVEALPQKYYREGHLPGAIHLPHDEVRQRAAQVLPNKNAFIVVYCASTSCQNSTIAARTLDSMGYTNVAEYVEGKQDWIEANLPLETSTAEATA